MGNARECMHPIASEKETMLRYHCKAHSARCASHVRIRYAKSTHNLGIEEYELVQFTGTKDIPSKALCKKCKIGFAPPGPAN